MAVVRFQDSPGCKKCQKQPACLRFSCRHPGEVLGFRGEYPRGAPIGALLAVDQHTHTLKTYDTPSGARYPHMGAQELLKVTFYSRPDRDRLIASSLSVAESLFQRRNSDDQLSAVIHQDPIPEVTICTSTARPCGPTSTSSPALPEVPSFLCDEKRRPSHRGRHRQAWPRSSENVHLRQSLAEVITPDAMTRPPLLIDLLTFKSNSPS